MGESYLVYAHRSSTGQLSTSICTRTRPLAAAAEDLTYLRSLRAIKPGTLALVTGRVELLEWPRPANGERRGMPGLTVTATGGGRTFSARTDTRGAFELTGLPPGTYEVVAKAPEGYEAVSRRHEIHDPRGCGPLPLFIRYDGRVTGRVVGPRGAVRGLPLELLPAPDPRKPAADNRVQAWTAADGTFELRLVPPGEYVLTFNSILDFDNRLALPRAFYPGVTDPTAAAPILVSAGARVPLRDFVLPDGIPLVTVEGIVVDPAGQPVREASIVLSDSSEGPNAIGPRFTTGDDGRFAFTVIDGKKYELHATRYVGSDSQTREAHIGMMPFMASGNTPLLLA